MLYKVIIFTILNFAALGLGGLLMGEGPKSDWYESLNKAPWTPPGWVFGAAWTLIMICFSFYIAVVIDKTEETKFTIFLFTIQFILNVIWNPAFFRYHQILPSLIIITLLTLLIGYMFYYFYNQVKSSSILIVPYLLWLLIATSLNAYIYIKN